MKIWKKALTAVMALTVIFAAFGMITYAAAEDQTTPPVTECDHNYQWKTTTAPTCQPGVETNTCTKCGKTNGTRELAPVKDHESRRVRELKRPTCVNDGWARHLCKNCAQDYIVVLPATGRHAWISETVKSPSCTQKGENRTYCKDCGEEKDRTEIPALGHDMKWRLVKRSTCTQEGLEMMACARRGCQYSTGEKRSTPKKPHQYEDSTWQTTKQPTCTQNGKSEKISKCKNCGTETRETREIEALGHSYGEWKVTKQPTETKPGEKVQTCTRCGDKITARIPAKGNHQHKFNGKTEVVKEATCTKSGLKRVYCSVGGCTEYDEIVISSGHKYGGWVVTKEATPEKNGTRTRTCSLCGNVLTESFAYYVAPSEEVTDEVIDEVTDVTDEVAEITEDLGTTAVADEPAEEEDSNTGMIIGIVAAALAVIAGGAGIAFAVKKKKQ